MAFGMQKYVCFRAECHIWVVRKSKRSIPVYSVNHLFWLLRIPCSPLSKVGYEGFGVCVHVRIQFQSPMKIRRTFWQIRNKKKLFGQRHQDARLRNFISTSKQAQSAIFISSWPPLHLQCRNEWDTDGTLCKVHYPSTSCIALINCQRDVNKQV